MIVLLQTHVLVVVLFLLLFTIKVMLLLLNKQNALGKVKKNTRVLDIIFGVLILATGGWLLLNWNGPIPAYLLVKIILVLIAIPLGIIGLKRNNKVLAILALFIFAYVYGIAETDSTTMKSQPEATNEAIVPETLETDAIETGDSEQMDDEATQEEIVAAIGESTLTNAKSIYVQVCANCHGEDGSKQPNSAPALTVSRLSQNERKLIIEHGRGTMPAYGSQLTEQEAEALAAYTMTLKTN